jgi:hypothetical protein
MIEKVVNRKNMLKAYRQVVSNGGSAGVDGMSVKELSSHLRENRDGIVMAVLMVTTITLKRLMQRGYESLLDHYERVSPHLCAEALRCAGTT